MENQILNKYEAPMVEIIECEVEKGFALSVIVATDEWGDVVTD